MAYRRRNSANTSSTLTEDLPSSPSHDDGSSLAARAIRASFLHRDSSFSTAYGESVMPSPQRESPVERPMHPLQRPTTYEYTSMKNLNATKSGFWGVLARKAKTIFEEENGVQKFETFDRASPRAAELSGPSSSQLHQSTDIPDTVRTEKLKIQKGLGAIASSLDYIGGKLGNALEEGFTIVETKAADIISDTRKINMRRKVNTSTTVGQTQQSIHSDIKAVNMPAIKTLVTCTDFETQLKASRDVAMTMAAKTKLLLRELKTVKANLSFAKQRCTQLEEENKILRESTAKGDSPEDDDLIRLQLETLLAEKARLAHENSVYARENRFLREVVEYHQLTMQDVVYLDEGVEEVKEVYPIHIPFERQPDSISHLSPGRSPLPSPLPSPCVPHTSSALSSNPET